ncbi:hypothetical protein ACIBAG_04290 [Streptomyces sp. NPDC051243]|uniref:hypothetical protein n=1 Tax=Streptomyces sp. NPDC051243 TaxID=3365646 RepID=UPI0037A79565
MTRAKSFRLRETQAAQENTSSLPITAGTYIEMASRVTEPVLLGLAVLAVRNRAERRPQRPTVQRSTERHSRRALE